MLADSERFNVAVFGEDCPVNWVEILDYLDDVLEYRLNALDISENAPDYEDTLQALKAEIFSQWRDGKLTAVPDPVKNWEAYDGPFWERMGGVKPVNELEIYKGLNAELRKRVQENPTDPVEWLVDDIWHEYWSGRFSRIPRPESRDPKELILWLCKEYVSEDDGDTFMILDVSRNSITIQVQTLIFDADGEVTGSYWSDDDIIDVHPMDVRRMLGAKHLYFEGERLI